MISIIIASRDEGKEINETIKAIVDSIDVDYEIIVIDDCSKQPVKDDNALIIRNDLPEGFQACIDKGVYAAKYDYIAIFNPRMRFYSKNWASKMLDNLHKYKKTMFCTTSAVLRFDNKKKPEGYRYGADIHLHSKLGDKYISFQPEWKKKQKGVYVIPCVQGANYFMPTQLYKYVKGFKLLSGYGGSLAYLSLKVWAMGGRVMIDTNVKIGNIYYNDNEQKPYTINFEDYFWNRIVTGFVLLEWDEAVKILFNYTDNEYFDLIKNRLIKSMPEVLAMRNYLNKNKRRDISDLLTIKNN